LKPVNVNQYHVDAIGVYALKIDHGRIFWLRVEKNRGDDLNLSMTHKKFLKRRFQLHWGGGWITEEARSRTQYHEPSIQLLCFDSGDRSIRFCYYHDGFYQGGPLILSESHLAGLRREIRKNKNIHALLKKLI